PTPPSLRRGHLRRLRRALVLKAMRLERCGRDLGFAESGLRLPLLRLAGTSARGHVGGDQRCNNNAHWRLPAMTMFRGSGYAIKTVSPL
ncbi:MAG: hypothetical protein WB696_18430, partial [Chthoniobacterales bacterium]